MKNITSLRLCVSAPLRLILVLTILFPQLALANPWGKDADLAIPCSVPCEIPYHSQSLSPLDRFGEVCIQFHQEVISPADGPRSNFIPSSSQYTLDGIRKYGFFKGCLLGFDRLMRENDDPWVYQKTIGPLGLIKYDPVR